METPSGYKGLAAFHKYWGKKPLDSLEYLVDLLSEPGDVVVDPFLGFGLLARRVALMDRRFVGIDINPISIQLASLFLTPPSWGEYAAALDRLSTRIKQQIDESYKLVDGQTATHYLWDQSILSSVWIAGKRGTPRIELEPTPHDSEVIDEYSDYETKLLRSPRFFKNSRINMNSNMGFPDLFTGRALRNIDLILGAISDEPKHVKRSLLLTLTSSVGQMSKMVFAITRRGKASGSQAERTEVGSWVIGYWRPKVHFEINVWNSYLNRANRLLRALKQGSADQQIAPVYELKSFEHDDSRVCLIKSDCRSALDRMKPNSVDLIITDPPHSDRIPYLEMSEMWNCILGESPDFENEIVVSNAPSRGKDKNTYNHSMVEFLEGAVRVLNSGGLLALMFNARDDKSWTYFRNFINGQSPIRYLGAFPIKYSAGSVVQDNRSGALKHDHILVFVKGTPRVEIEDRLAGITGWQVEMPQNGD